MSFLLHLSMDILFNFRLPAACFFSIASGTVFHHSALIFISANTKCSLDDPNWHRKLNILELNLPLLIFSSFNATFDTSLWFTSSKSNSQFSICTFWQFSNACSMFCGIASPLIPLSTSSSTLLQYFTKINLSVLSTQNELI